MEFGKQMGEKLQGEGVWVPKTPAKSIPARRWPVSVDGKRENLVGGSFSAGTSQDSTDLNAMASAGSIEGTCDEFDLNKSPNELGLGDSSHASCDDVLAGKQGRENHDQVHESECLEGTNGAEACVVGLAESFGLMGCESTSRGGVNCGETLSGLDKISFMELLGSTGEAPPGFETYAASGAGFGRMPGGLRPASHFQDDSSMNTPPILAAAPATSRAAVDKMSISFPDPLSEIGRRTTLIYPDYGPNQEKHKDDGLSAFHEDGKFHNDEKPQPSIGSASAAFSTPSEKGNTGRRHKDGVDLNKQSRKKPRKKKYWPKVVFEGTPKKTPKPVTPKPSTPKPRTPKPPKHMTSEKGSDKKKRKYIRKNSLRASTKPSEDVGVDGQTVDPSAEYVLESGTQALSFSSSMENHERKYIQKNSLVASPKPSEVCVDGQVVDPSAEYVPKSCRRALNFDFSLQIHERDHGKDARMIIHQYQRRKKTMIKEGNESMIKNSAGMAFGFPQSEKWIKPMYMSVAEGGAANDPRPTNQAGCCYNSLEVYKRIFRVNQCLSNSRNLGPNFPGICKKSRMRRQKATISAFFIAPYTTMYGTLWSIICAEDSQRILKKRRMRRRKATKYIVAAKEQRLVKFSNFSLRTTDRRLAPQSSVKGLRVGVKSSSTKRSTVNVKSSSTKRSTANCNRLVPNCLGKLISPAKAQRWAPVNDPNSSKGVISLAPLATSKKKSNESTQRLNFRSSTLIPNCNQLPSALLTQGRFWNQEVLLADKENMVTKRQSETGLFLDNAVSGHNKMEVFPKDVLPTLESLQGEFSIAFTDVIERLEGLHISVEGGQLIVQNQNACDTIEEDRAVTPYNSRKRNSPPRVHIDQETMRVWKLHMVNGGEYAEEESDRDKEKWWEEQRKVFHGRVNSFIARMHLIQGDRRFSPWKGSVVDSVVGVFLTQNVSDHLSSSAFMSLAAKYPLQSTTTCTECDEDGEPAYGQESVGSNIGAVEPTLDANGNQSLACETELDMGHQLDNKITKKGRAISDVSEDSTVVQDEFSPQKCQDSLTGVSPSSIYKFSTTESSSGFTEIVDLEEIACLHEFSNCEMGNMLWNESSVDCNISRKLENGKQGSSSNRLCDANGTHVSVCSTSSQKSYSFVPLTPSELQVDSQEILADLTNTKVKDVGDISKNLGCMGPSGCESIVQQKATPRAHEATVDQCASLSKCQVLSECSSQAEVKPAKGRGSSKNQQRGSKIIQQTETPLRKTKSKVEEKQENTINWDDLRNTYASGGAMETTSDTMDSLDWEAVRQATVDEVADAIKGRGQHRVLAKRIKDFLDRVVMDHGSINLEWLRDVPPDKAKDYLLSFKGLGLKSVECVRLLTLHHHAFPVDTNVGRVAVRLGWVPLQPLPGSLQIHLLEQYPLMDTIQIYLWPRLCTLDQRTLYELHYQMITFGKVFCRKRKPNCNACPMRGDCRHFASAVASARLALPGPQEKSMSSMVPVAAVQKSAMVITPATKSLPEAPFSESRYQTKNCEPIIEHPTSPKPEYTEHLERDIEDYYDESEDDIPTIRLDTEQFKKHLLEFVNKTKIPLEEGDMSKALVLNAENASIPVPKLKDVSRLRTVHYVYELPDSHPILAGLDKREPDDPCPYLLAIWTSGETNSSKPPRKQCDSQGADLCNEDMCFSCNNIEDQNFQTVCGTILIPCRTATRGSFPLNGTYFQVNEVFADDESSQHPLNVPRAWIWNLPRRPLYCGAYATAIFRDLSTAEIQNCFWRGFVCVRAFNQKTRAPVHLSKIFHISTSLGGKRKFVEDE